MSKTQTEKKRPEAFKKEKTELDVPLLDQWIAEHYREPEDILGREGLLAQVDQGGGGTGAGGGVDASPGLRQGWCAGRGRGPLPQGDECQDAGGRRREGRARQPAGPAEPL